MAVEIERKFLVRAEKLALDGLPRKHLRTGYLTESGATVRVRIVDGQHGFLAVKAKVPGARFAKEEYEYPIPLADAQALMARADKRVIEKTRYLLALHAHVFEIDVFEGAYAGLVLAEVELGHENESFVRPPWLGREVTFDKRYSCRKMAFAKAGKRARRRTRV